MMMCLFLLRYKKHVVVEDVSTRGIDGDQSADVSDEEGASRPSVSCLFFYVKQKERRDDALTSVQQDIRLPQITLLLTIVLSSLNRPPFLDLSRVYLVVVFYETQDISNATFFFSSSQREHPTLNKELPIRCHKILCIALAIDLL